MRIRKPKFMTEKDMEIIVDLYKYNDTAHGIDHVLKVMSRAMVISEKLNMIYDRKTELACLLHDIGCWVNRKEHHEIGAQMVMGLSKTSQGKQLFRGMSDDDMKDIYEAIRSHRGSWEYAFYSELGELVSASDREPPARSLKELLETKIYRSMQYAKSHDIGKDINERYFYAVQHVSEKYGSCGYARKSDVYLRVYAKLIRKEYNFINWLFGGSYYMCMPDRFLKIIHDFQAGLLDDPEVA